MTRTSTLALLVLFSSGTAFAQDPVEAQPTEPGSIEPTSQQGPIEPPSEVPPPVRPPARDLTDADVPVTAPPEVQTHQLILPPWYEYQRGDSGLRALFPFYFSSWTRNSNTLLIPPYYQRRGPAGRATDVVFPFFWSYRKPTGDLLVIPPFYTNDTDNGWDLGIAPLFFAGRTDKSHYIVVPPLFWNFWDEDSSTTIAGLFYRRTTPTSSAWGIPPLAFFGSSEGKSYNVVFPFYWHFADEDAGTGVTVVGPAYGRHGPGWSSFGLVPFIFTASGQNWSRTTVLPFLHYSRNGDDRMTLITPLFGYDERPHSTTLITPLYQQVRSATSLDSVAPLFWYWRRPRVGSSHLLLGPYYHESDPISRADVVFPFFWDFQRYGDSRTTAIAPLFLYSNSRSEHSTNLWIAPTIQYARDPEGWAFNIHPLLYSGGTARTNHQVLFPFFYRFENEAGPDTVVFPFVWDFTDRPSASHDLVLFPFFWQFRSEDSYTQVLLNSVYTEGRCERGSGRSWRFDLVPLFAFGAPCPGDVYWSVLYGLVGYRTAGRYRKLQIFWLPFDITPDAPREREPRVVMNDLR